MEVLRHEGVLSGEHKRTDTITFQLISRHVLISRKPKLEDFGSFCTYDVLLIGIGVESSRALGPVITRARGGLIDVPRESMTRHPPRP
jgi:hypothetical protein